MATNRYCYTFRKTHSIPNFRANPIFPLREIMLSNSSDNHIQRKLFVIRSLSYQQNIVSLSIDWIRASSSSLRLAIQARQKNGQLLTQFFPTSPRTIYGKNTGFRWISLYEHIFNIFGKIDILSETLVIYLTQYGQTWEIFSCLNSLTTKKIQADI